MIQFFKKQKIQKLIALLVIISNQSTLANPILNNQAELDNLKLNIRELTLSLSKQNVEDIDQIFDQLESLIDSLTNPVNKDAMNSTSQDQVSMLIDRSSNAILSILRNSNTHLHDVAIVKLNNLIQQLKFAALKFEGMSGYKQTDRKMQTEWESTINASILTLKDRLLKSLNSNSLTKENKRRVIEILFDNYEQFKTAKTLVNADDILIAIEGNKETVKQLVDLSEFQKNLVLMFLNQIEDVGYTKENLDFIKGLNSEYTNNKRALSLTELKNLMDISLRFATMDIKTIQDTNLNTLRIIQNSDNLKTILQAESGRQTLFTLINGLLHMKNAKYSSEGLNLTGVILRATILLANESDRQLVISQFIESLDLNGKSAIKNSLASYNTNVKNTLNQLVGHLKTKALPIIRQLKLQDSNLEISINQFIISVDQAVNSDTDMISNILKLKRQQGQIIQECRRILIIK